MSFENPWFKSHFQQKTSQKNHVDADVWIAAIKALFVQIVDVVHLLEKVIQLFYNTFTVSSLPSDRVSIFWSSAGKSSSHQPMNTALIVKQPLPEAWENKRAMNCYVICINEV